MIRVPKVFLVDRRCVSDPRVLQALNITPVVAALAAGADDCVAASELSATVVLRGAPIAIVAEFPDPLTVISDDSSVEILVGHE